MPRTSLIASSCLSLRKPASQWQAHPVNTSLSHSDAVAATTGARRKNRANVPYSLFFALIFASPIFCRYAPAALQPTQLRCEFAINPLSVDSPKPRLFWKVESDTRNEQQSAYELLVSSSKKSLSENRGDLWDSGKISSDETIHIPYGGQDLK